MRKFRDSQYKKDFYRIMECCLRIIPDRVYIQLKHFRVFHRFVDLKNPVTFNEKLQWLKLYYHPDVFTQMADKYAAREYIAERIGEEHLVPLIGCWDNADDIDFDSLPEKFVLKCNHDSGSYIICKDKRTLNIKKIRRTLNSALKRDFYLHNREWPYKNIRRRIVAEELLESPGRDNAEEYMFFCFDGQVAVMATFNRTSRKGVYIIDCYDADYRFVKLDIGGTNSPNPPDIRTPYVEQMVEYAKILSTDIPHVRINFFYVGGQIYVGEMTLSTGGGFEKIDPPEWNYKLGEFLHIPERKEC